MKAIVCEMCGSHDLIKQDGVYVCQHCGTKYSVEEAKKLIIDLSNISDENPIPVKPVGNIENLKKLSRAAIDAENGKEALQYANQILETNAEDFDGWVLKYDALLVSKAPYNELVNTYAKVQQYYTPAEHNPSDWTIPELCVNKLICYITATTIAAAHFFQSTNESIQKLYKSQLKLSNFDFSGTRSYASSMDTHFDEMDSLAVQGLDLLEDIAIKERIQDPKFQKSIDTCVDALICETYYAGERLASYGKTLPLLNERIAREKKIKDAIKSYNDSVKAKEEDRKLEESGATGNLSADEYHELQAKEKELKTVSGEDNTSGMIGMICLGVLLFVGGYFMFNQDNPFNIDIFVLCLIPGLCIILYGVISSRKKEKVKKERMEALAKEIQPLKEKQGSVSTSVTEN